MISVRRTLMAVLVAMLLVGTAGVSTWLLASAGVFAGTEQPIPGAPESTTESASAGAAGAGGLEFNSGFQVSQPRDPFKPLISGGDATTTTIDDESTTTTIDDGSSTTTTVGGGSTTTTTTVTGSTTTTTAGDSPDGIRVALLEVRDESGSLVSVVEVDGETYTVGVGDTFAGNFKVISLTETGGVFTFGDSAFTLNVGQSIFK
jgi:hypothetical protein